MDTSPQQSLAPHVGLLLWRRILTGREVFVLEYEDQLVLPKGPLEPEETERAATARLAAAFAGARVSNRHHLSSDHPEGPAGRTSVGWWSLEWMGLGPMQRESLTGQGHWIATAEASVLLHHARERVLVAGLQPTRWERITRSLSRWSGSPQDRSRRHLQQRRCSILGRTHDSNPDADWQREALEQIDLAESCLCDGDGAGYREALDSARRLELQGLDRWELDQARDELEREIKDELQGLERKHARALLGDARDAQALTQAAAILGSERQKKNQVRAGRREQQRWLGTVLLAGVLGIWLAGPGAGPADPTHLTLLLHGLLGGALSALLWPKADGLEPEFLDVGRLLLRPLLGVLCALIFCQLLSVGVLRMGSDDESAWRLAAFVAGFGERLFLSRR